MLRAALTQTVNAFADMPESVSELGSLKGRLEDIRRANVAHNIELIASAKKQGAAIVCLGELFTGPYFALTEDPLWTGLAEDALKGRTAEEISKTAAENAVIVIAPLYELDSETGKRYNTAVVFDEKGGILGRYRKNHIPRGENEQGRFTETFYYGTGEPPVREGKTPYFPVFETSAGRIGVNICYDRHFEGVVASLARAGAEIVFSPAVTFGEKSRRMWDLEFRVDAARHRVFIGGSNRKGSEKPWGLEFFGESHFAGPEGTRLEDVSNDPRLVISELDLNVLRREDPSGWNLARDRRPAIYSKD